MIFGDNLSKNTCFKWLNYSIHLCQWFCRPKTLVYVHRTCACMLNSKSFLNIGLRNYTWNKWHILTIYNADISEPIKFQHFFCIFTSISFPFKSVVVCLSRARKELKSCTWVSKMRLCVVCMCVCVCVFSHSFFLSSFYCDVINFRFDIKNFWWMEDNMAFYATRRYGIDSAITT